MASKMEIEKIMKYQATTQLAPPKDRGQRKERCEAAADILEPKSWDDIKTQFRKKSLLYHPDKCSLEKATDVTKIIIWAKKTLWEHEDTAREIIFKRKIRRSSEKQERMSKLNINKKYNIHNIGKMTKKNPKKPNSTKKSPPKRKTKKPTNLPDHSKIKPTPVRPTEVLTARQYEQKKASKKNLLQSPNGIRADIAFRRMENTFFN